MYKVSIGCFLIAISFCNIQQIRCQVTKCCPDGFFLQALDYPNFTNYSCQTLENQTIWDSHNLGSNPSIPNCDRQIQTVFENMETYINLNGCFDKNTNDQYVAVSCVQNEGNNFSVGVHLINKCCPIGQSYDHIKRSCALNLNSYTHFKNIFENSVVILENNLPECSKDEVFVEYSSIVHSIRFSEKNLKVNGNHLLADKFCIEDLLNVDPSDGGSNEQHIIIRSCRPRTVCNEMPCIRRCCSTDQIMLNRPMAQRCQSHPSNANLQPIFYDLTFPLSNVQTKTQPKGMNSFIHKSQNKKNEFTIKIRLI